MSYVQINLILTHNWLLNKTPYLGTIVWDNVGSSLEWVVDTQQATYDNEEQYWIDLDLVPRVEDVTLCCILSPMEIESRVSFSCLLMLRL